MATFNQIICVVLVVVATVNADVAVCHKWPTKTTVVLTKQSRAQNKHYIRSSKLFVRFCNQFSFYKGVSYTNIFFQSMFVSIMLRPLLKGQFRDRSTRLRINPGKIHFSALFCIISILSDKYWGKLVCHTGYAYSRTGLTTLTNTYTDQIFLSNPCTL